MTYPDPLERIVTDTLVPLALRADTEARFPRELVLTADQETLYSQDGHSLEAGCRQQGRAVRLTDT